jgi:hypothetical protein
MQTQLVHVESSFRDNAAQSSVTITLDKVFNHVSAIQLVEAVIPMTMQTIDATNDTFEIDVRYRPNVSTTVIRTRVVTVKHGFYEVDTLLDAINAAYVAAYPGESVVFSVTGTEWKLTITCGQTGTLTDVRVTDSKFPAVYAVTGGTGEWVQKFTSHSVITTKQPSYCYLRIPELPGGRHILHGGNSRAPSGFLLRLPLNGPKLGDSMVSVEDTKSRHYLHKFSPILSSVHRITIELLDPHFNVMHLQGASVSVLLEISYG